MLYVTLDRVVRRPPPIVWQVLTDLAAATSWVDGLVDVRAVQGRKLEPGAQLAVQRRVQQGKTDHVITEITAFRAPSLLALETQLTKKVLYDRVSLASVPEGTRVTFSAELHGVMTGRAPGLSPPTALEMVLRGAYERSLDALATRIERESAIPYR